MAVPAETTSQAPTRKRVRQPKPTEDRLAYSIPEAAAKLGLGKSTMWTWIKLGTVKTTKIGPNGGRTVITAEELNSLLSRKAA